VICVGQAAGRADVTVERVAVNIDDSRIPDNEGKNPVDLPIVPDGPVAYWSTLPIKTIVQALGSSGVPASVSNSAGTFVCNHIFYGLMHALAQSAGETKGGFIHLPLLPEQIAGGGGGRPPKAAATPPKAPDGRPSLPLETMVEALAIAVRESLRPLAACRTSSSSLLE
jgi:pyroglutamyl-peptidase